MTIPAEWDSALKMLSPNLRPDLRSLRGCFVSTAVVLLTVSCCFLRGMGRVWGDVPIGPATAEQPQGRSVGALGQAGQSVLIRPRASDALLVAASLSGAEPAAALEASWPSAEMAYSR